MTRGPERASATTSSKTACVISTLQMSLRVCLKSPSPCEGEVSLASKVPSGDLVIPAKAGIHIWYKPIRAWTPASAGVTDVF